MPGPGSARARHHGSDIAHVDKQFPAVRQNDAQRVDDPFACVQLAEDLDVNDLGVGDQQAAQQAQAAFAMAVFDGRGEPLSDVREVAPRLVPSDFSRRHLYYTTAPADYLSSRPLP